jgi:hypothetical protein
MKLDIAIVVVFVGGIAFLLAMWLLGGCYRCTDPACSNLPPEPDPWVEMTRNKDASADR